MENNLTPAQITALLMSGRRKAALTSFAILTDGSKVPLRTGEVGRFDSKAGTPRKSRKGRTYRAPNGYATYVPGNEAILAYKP